MIPYTLRVQNYITDRNLRVGLLIVDEEHDYVPPLQRDIYWNEDAPQMPHTVASEGVMDNPVQASTANIV